LTNNLAIILIVFGLWKTARFFLTGIEPVGGGDDAVGPPIDQFVSIAFRLDGKPLFAAKRQ
jgi:hypothetical protein